MKKMVFIACALMVLAAGPAMAGSNLAWNDCLGGGGVLDRVHACTNTGIGNMFVSFVAPVDLPSIAASDVFTDVQAPTSINTWWLTPVVGTRWGALAGSSPTGACPGWFDLAPNGPIAFSPTAIQLSSSRMRLRSSIVIAAGEEQLASAGTEYLCGQIQLKNNAGTLNNPECLAGAAIGITNLTLLQPGVPDHVMESPQGTNCVTSRGGGGPTCPDATPTKKATWGSIKALYR